MQSLKVEDILSLLESILAKSDPAAEDLLRAMFLGTSTWCFGIFFDALRFTDKMVERGQV